MRLEINIEGLDEAAEKVREAPELLRRYLLAGFIDAAALIAQAASANAAKMPGATGELAGSMQVDVRDSGESFEVTVGPKAFYAGWVEVGHRVGKRGERVQNRLRRALGIKGDMVPAHPYFFPAVDMLRGDISAAIREAIARAERESQ